MTELQMTEPVRWRTASHSNGTGGNCVEVGGLRGGHRAVRDSKDRTGPALVVGPVAWAAFLTGMHGGELAR